jgi:hypothetical protein
MSDVVRVNITQMIENGRLVDYPIRLRVRQNYTL